MAPGVRRIRLKPGQGGGTLDLLEVAPGTALPPCGRGGLGLTCVLRGSFSDRLGRFGPGDLAEADPSIEPRPVAGEAGCVSLVAVERHQKMHGLFARLLQPTTE